MPELPIQIHSAAQVRAIDRFAIDHGVAGYTLMNRAAQAAMDVLQERWPHAREVVVVCGAGNNGGDGYCLARLAHSTHRGVRVLSAIDASRLSGDALRARNECVAAGVSVEPFRPDHLAQADVIVDALFGTGLDRPLDATLGAVITAMNDASAPVLALDLPSGLQADTGARMGAVVNADATVTFVGLKAGCFLGDGPDVCGELRFSDLDIPAGPDSLRQPVLERLDPRFIGEHLRPRTRTAHKGDFGRVLVIGGNHGMAGAVRLSGEACLRSGAGLVTIATRPENCIAVVTGRPELMCRAVEQAEQLSPLLEQADIVVIGPGLGRDTWAIALLDAVLQGAHPLVVDADALNLLAVRRAVVRREDWILTPHPGEAGRLLERTTEEVQRDRLAALQALVERYGGTIVLKGAGTLIGSAGRTPALCDRGNPGMATAGTGDVLAGCVGGLLGQLRNPWNAARIGVLAHALAGDRAARDGERGLIATDLLPHLRAWLNPR